MAAMVRNCFKIHQTRSLWMAAMLKSQSTATSESPKATSTSPPPKDPSDPTKYNATEYYTYSEYSYYDIDRECITKRVKQPKAPQKEL